MFLTVVIISSYVFLILASLGVVNLKNEGDDEEDTISRGSFGRASKWMLLCFTPGVVAYLLNAFIPAVHVPSSLTATLISGGFILGFCFFYVTEKRLRNRRRSEMKKPE